MDIAKQKAEARKLLDQAREITSRVQHEGRGLTDEESARIDDLTSKAGAIAEGIKTQERLARAGGKALIGDGDTLGESGWKAAAKAFVKGERTYRGKAGDLMGKALTAASTADHAIQLEDGIAPLTEDVRGIADFFPRKQLDAGALSVDEYFIAARSVSSGSVERDPMATSAKAEIAVTIDLDSADARQFAGLISDIPNQMFESVDGLEAILRDSLGREITQSMDAHALAKLAAAGIPLVSAGSSVIEKLAYAAADIRNRGGTPTLALISEQDMVAIQLMTEDNLPQGFPYGLRVIASPHIPAGDGLVADPSGAVLYAGEARFDVDPYSGFDTNESRVRLEGNAVFHVRDANKFELLQPGLTT